MTKNFRAVKSVIRLILFMLVTTHCSFAQDSWSVVFRGIGTFSSPRVTDLNLDGIGDIILGAENVPIPRNTTDQESCATEQ